MLDSRSGELIGERDREAFAAAGRACTALSWRYAVWDRLDGVVIANQRWLAGGPDGIVDENLAGGARSGDHR